MSKRKQIRIWVDEETDSYISDYQFKNNIKTFGQALDHLIENKKVKDKEEYSLSYIAGTVAKVVSDKVKSDLSNDINKIKLGTNNTDRNTQILIELMNGHLDQLDYGHFLTTDLQETMPLEISKQVVQERITKQKQRKDSYYK